MIRVIDVRDSSVLTPDAIPRANVDVGAVTPTVLDLMAQVRAGGSAAVLDIGERFDGVRAPQLRVPDQVLRSALVALDAQEREALELAIDRVRRTHADQLPNAHVTELAPGAVVSQRWVPVDRVGLYVPGGRAVYPSSVVMNVVPAQVAGVPSLAVVSPPQRDFGGWPHPSVLAAAALLGVDEVYACGGAQAIAWLAYGSPIGDSVQCNRAAMITGPGNIYVAAAKRAVAGLVGIDSEAGPTEIMVVADQMANPRFVAADLISQAEHDVIAASVLVTDSQPLILAVQDELDAQVSQTKHSDRIREALSGPQSAAILVRDLEQAVEVANTYGAEHLEIQTADPRSVAAKIRNAGAVFVGDWSPVSLGDYCAGSNHVLPTGGCACFSSGLSVHSFLRSMQVIDYSRAALQEVAADVVTLSTAEDLPAHGRAVTIRSDVQDV